MTIAVLADIHANIYALETVLADIEKRNVERIICAGDLVGYSPFPNEVIDLIRRRRIETVRGNYDEGVGFELLVCGCDFKDAAAAERGAISNQWTQEHTTEENKEFLRSLPKELTFTSHGKQVLVVHGSPRRLNEYLWEDLPAEVFQEVLAGVEADVLLCGHTHKPYYKKIAGKHIINVGSVGKPKDGDPRALYTLVDLAQGVEFEFIKVDYDWERAARAIEEAGLPGEFAEQLRRGRG